MQLHLGQNIQSYRKERGMTQEQLAEAMGVTVGAISKWENGLSNPDISMIVELADFFEISVDVLLGYYMEKKSIKDTAEYIKKLGKEKRYEEGEAESKKALQKYPNNFQIVYASAELEGNRGLECKDSEAIRNSIRLLEKADQLIEQNEDERISSAEIQIRIGRNYGYLGQYDEAITRLKKVNPGGINDAIIGTFYIEQEKYEEAIEYLSVSFENSIIQSISTVNALCNCTTWKNQLDQTIELATWMKHYLVSLAPEGELGYFTKSIAYMESHIAIAYLMKSDMQHAKEAIRNANRCIEEFNQKKEYYLNLRFTKNTGHILHDNAGNGEDYFRNIFEQCKDMPTLQKQFQQLYEEVKEEEKEWKQNN